MYDTSPHYPLKGEIRQLWPEDISTKELESLFDLDPALEESLDFSEFDTNTELPPPPSRVGTAPGVPDSAVVTTPVVTRGGGDSVNLLTLTAAATTEHLAKLEGQAPSFTATVPASSGAVSLPNLQPSSPSQVAMPADGEVGSTFGQDVLMPEFHSQVAVSAPATSTSQEGGGNWGQPFYTTVKVEDLTSLTACSLEASLPGFNSSVCKSELDDSCSEFSNLSPRSTRSLSESSTATSTVPDSPRRPSKGRSRRRQVPKDSDEYKEKRARNNIAVRKSRAKAKEKQRMTEERVKELMDLNESLHKRLEMLTKEVTVLKGLFINVGASLPEDFSKLMEVS